MFGESSLNARQAAGSDAVLGRGVTVPVRYDAGRGVEFSVTLSVDGGSDFELEPGSRRILKLSPGEHVLALSDPRQGLFSKPDWPVFEISLDTRELVDPGISIEARNKILFHTLEIVVMSGEVEHARYKVDLN